MRSFLEPRTGRLLLVDADDARRTEIGELLRDDNLDIRLVSTAAAARGALKDNSYDAAVICVDLPDTRGFDLVDEIREQMSLSDLPILFYATRELNKKEELHLKRLTQTTTLKDVRSPARLLDEVALFLHRPISQMSPQRRRLIEGLHETSTVLASKKVLIVDDDIRNIFAMTSILEPYQMNILSAETGKAAIEILQQNPEMDVVLMDIMMPDMDGYDTMRAIRKVAKFRALPIIALTAKAMKGDREKCIEAGASDYIAKPVDTEQLLSLLRVWLYR